MIGHILGNYQIEKELGLGGFGNVYLAKHRNLGTQVALKIPIHPDYIQALMSEGVVHHALQSPHIVKILDLYKDSVPPFIVMEYVSGGSLRDYLKQKKNLSIEETLQILEQIGLALQEAHKQHLIHGDLKPENILRTEDGIWKLTDFGLSRQENALSVDYSGSISANLTKQLNIAGTLKYMAPEALQGQATLQSDLYSLGILLFEMLIGGPPQGIETIGQNLEQVPENLDIFFARCYTSPEKRFASIDEFLDELRLLKKITNKQIQSGKVIARVSAFILDFTFLSFICLMPFFRPFLLRSYFTYFLAWVLYSTLFHTFFGKTPGKAIFALRVVRSDFQPINGVTALIRSILVIPSALTTLGIYPALFDSKKRTAHDLACNTLVIEEEKR